MKYARCEINDMDKSELDKERFVDDMIIVITCVQKFLQLNFLIPLMGCMCIAGKHIFCK